MDPGVRAARSEQAVHATRIRVQAHLKKAEAENWPHQPGASGTTRDDVWRGCWCNDMPCGHVRADARPSPKRTYIRAPSLGARAKT
jgi:hypothetical protein